MAVLQGITPTHWDLVRQVVLEVEDCAVFADGEQYQADPTELGYPAA